MTPTTKTNNTYLFDTVRDAITMSIRLTPEGDYNSIDYMLRSLDKMYLFTMFSKEYYNKTLDTIFNPLETKNIPNVGIHQHVIMDNIHSTKAVLELYGVDINKIAEIAYNSLTIIKDNSSFIKDNIYKNTASEILETVEIDKNIFLNNHIALILYLYKLYMKPIRSTFNLELEKISTILKN